MNDPLIDIVAMHLPVSDIPELVVQYLSYNRCKSIHVIYERIIRSFPETVDLRESTYHNSRIWNGIVLQDFSGRNISVLMNTYGCDSWFTVTCGRKSVCSKNQFGNLEELCFETVLDVRWNPKREKLLRKKELLRFKDYVTCVEIVTTIGSVHVDLWHKKLKHVKLYRKFCIVKFIYNNEEHTSP